MAAFMAVLNNSLALVLPTDPIDPEYMINH